MDGILKDLDSYIKMQPPHVNTEHLRLRLYLMSGYLRFKHQSSLEALHSSLPASASSAEMNQRSACCVSQSASVVVQIRVITLHTSDQSIERNRDSVIFKL